MAINEPQFESFVFHDDGAFPNNANLALIRFSQVFEAKPEVNPENIEKTFRHNVWENSWRNGLYAFHHYHSTAHETLGIYRGWVKAQFGGPEGKVISAQAGDVIIVCQQQPHKTFQRKGADLLMQKTITLAEALTGVDFIFNHLDGSQVRVKN